MHKGQDPIPACGAEDRTHILTMLHLGLDLISHVPGTGPNPHYLAHSTTTRTRRLTTTIPFGLRLGQSSIAAARSIPGARVCVCVFVFKRLDMATDRMQGIVFRAQARLGYLCQRSYSKMGERWSGQPPVPASAASPKHPKMCCFYHGPNRETKTARLLQSVVVSSGPVCLPSHQYVPSQSVCVCVCMYVCVCVCVWVCVFACFCVVCMHANI